MNWEVQLFGQRNQEVIFFVKTVNGCNEIVEIPVTVKSLTTVTPSSNTPVCQGQTLSFVTGNARNRSYLSMDWTKFF